MISRRLLLVTLTIGLALSSFAASAAETNPYSAEAFNEAQKAGKSILVHINAPWCPVCQAQKPILAELAAEPKFKNLVVFEVDFDNQKDAVRAFNAQSQSTLIVFKGEMEIGRSVGDTHQKSIAALLASAL
jgi:thiol-disulfide isomerase/thioredoxin